MNMPGEIKKIMVDTPPISQSDYEGMRLVLHMSRNDGPLDSGMIVNHLLQKALKAAILSYEAQQGTSKGMVRG